MGKSVRLEPDVAQQLVAECNQLIARLEDHAVDATRLSLVSGFGALASAQELQAGFAHKAVGDAASVHARILQFRDQVVKIRDNFASGGDAFAAAEEANRAALRRSGGGLA